MSDYSIGKRLTNRDAMTKISTTVKNRELVKKRREQIVLAAISLFSRKGFYKTTLKELAEKAQLSYGNIYDYVGGKEDIIVLIHEYAYGMILDGLAQVVADVKDPVDQLRRMVRFEFTIMDAAADAILILYQYSHILKNEYLYRLLQAEREHIGRFESVLTACIDAGVIRSCNVRLNANLIKSMIDAWILKRWDMRGHITAAEAENEILEMVLNGLMDQQPDRPPGNLQPGFDFEGKTVFMANGATVVSAAVISRFLAANANVALYMDKQTVNPEYPVSFEDHPSVRIYTCNTHGPLTPALFDEIRRLSGTIDIYIHDTGLGNTRYPLSKKEVAAAKAALDENLASARDLGDFFLSDRSARQPDRTIFITPWQWDRYADPIRFEIQTAAVRALTSTLGEKAVRDGKNVNCVIPGWLKSPRPSAIEKQFLTRSAKGGTLDRFGAVNDLADGVLFLASGFSEYISGQAICVADMLKNTKGE